MARKTFFSFHYERDNWRAGQVRNCWLTQGDSAGYIDAAAWEEVKKKGQAAVEKWIDEQLYGTTVTVVLIGAETSTRPYVKTEIDKSAAKGNGLLGIYIHNVKDVNSKTDVKGSSPLPSTYATYDWVNDDGRKNLAPRYEVWVTNAGRR